MSKGHPIFKLIVIDLFGNIDDYIEIDDYIDLFWGYQWLNFTSKSNRINERERVKEIYLTNPTASNLIQKKKNFPSQRSLGGVSCHPF